MNTRPEEEAPVANEVHPAVALVGELHEYLLSALVEKLGDDVQVAEAADPGNGLVAYRFEIHGAQCRAAIVPYTALGAVLSLNARLGRVQSGYGWALRLGGPTHRAPGLGEVGGVDERPLHFLLLCDALAGAVGKELQMLNSKRMRELAADDPGLRAKVVAARLRATIALGRYREALEVLPQVDDSLVPPSRKATLEAECLCELDQPEEALDVLQSAELDEDPWVHLIRSCACMKLGRHEEAAQHFTNYEELVGHDSLARKRIAALAGDDDETA